MKEGETFDFKGYKVRLAGIEREVKHPGYNPEAGDIAVGARLEVVANDAAPATVATPIYLIRNSQIFSLKDEAPHLGLHFRFEKIDPKDGVMTIGVAQANEDQRKIPVEIAENVTRSDYIVLEAILFPGINLVWLGSLTMMLGLAIAMWRRLTEKA